MKKTPRALCASVLALLAAGVCQFTPTALLAADHNDPNAVNSIFSDIDPSAADLYDMFGFPSDDTAGGEKVVVALTFASVPRAGVLDTDMLYRLKFAPNPRVAPPLKDDQSLEAMIKYFDAVKDKYLNLKAAEVRVKVDKDQRAHVDFIDFPGATFSKTLNTNQVQTVQTPDGYPIKVYIGGRDDAFFNDLPGFFRSINYAPQYYHVPLAMRNARELPIPKTLIELEGNSLFNYNPESPKHGDGLKKDLPPGPWTWQGSKYLKDANGNFRFVYSGRDAQAGKNVNAIILEIPLAFLTRTPDTDRIVNTWGESWVLKAAGKAESIPDNSAKEDILNWFKKGLSVSRSSFDEELQKYKRVDTDGQPFADAALNERENDRQVGAQNFWLGPHFILRLGHLGWGFGPSISALGLRSAFDHGNSPISIHKVYEPYEIGDAFRRGKKVVFQELRMPDDKWNKKGLNIPLKRSFEIFVPNVCPIDMDTTGTWPYGRRFEDQVATRFLSLFIDQSSGPDGKSYNIETLNDPALWEHAAIEPKTVPNPQKNDKAFLDHFPYMADPW
ncbi:DUF4331 family protein [Verrucomicrobiota bacterium sgz303538]